MIQVDLGLFCVRQRRRKTRLHALKENEKAECICLCKIIAINDFARYFCRNTLLYILRPVESRTHDVMTSACMLIYKLPEARGSLAIAGFRNRLY